GFTEPTVCFMADDSVLCLMRTTDGRGPGPSYLSRSTDNGKSWSTPAVFDDLGVWPQMLRLKNGVTLASYGRPGLYVRATADPAGLSWAKRVTVVPPGAISTETCSYSALLPLGDNRALLAYSDFNLRDAEGKLCKGMRVREIRVMGSNAK
ncbi:MAG: sialidase family protein, partial [Nitrospiraceae bacterium]|nr:sialidase family protein [Nitrospiraceae bacterium]